jgi:hypothetical protein
LIPQRKPSSEHEPSFRAEWVMLSARLKQYYSRLRRTLPGTTGYRTPRSGDKPSPRVASSLGMLAKNGDWVNGELAATAGSREPGKKFRAVADYYSA